MKFLVTSHQILCRGMGIPPHGYFIDKDGQPVRIREGDDPFDSFFCYVAFSVAEARRALPEDADDGLRAAVEWAPLPEVADNDIAGARRDFFCLQVETGDATCCTCTVPHGHVYLMGRPISPPFVSKVQAFEAINGLAEWFPVQPERLEGLCREVGTWGDLPIYHLGLVR